jgi:hypothetical protein
LHSLARLRVHRRAAGRAEVHIATDGNERPE